jgi:hypothetical protein
VNGNGIPPAVQAWLDGLLATGEDPAAIIERLENVVRAEHLGLIERVELNGGGAAIVASDPFADLPTTDG